MSLDFEVEWDRLTDLDLRFTLFTDRLRSFNAASRLLSCDLSGLKDIETP